MSTDNVAPADLSAYGGLDAKTVAKRIHAHLKRLEAADETARAGLKHGDEGYERTRFYHAGASVASGGKVGIRYIAHHSTDNIDLDRAMAYLAYLDADPTHSQHHYSIVGDQSQRYTKAPQPWLDAVRALPHCAGCNATWPVQHSYSHDYVTIRLAPGREVKVCPKTPCERKAREKASYCLGCGDEWPRPDSVCDACKAKIARPDDDGVATEWWAIASDHALLASMDTSAKLGAGRMNHNVRQRLYVAFCQAISALTPAIPKFHWDRQHKGTLAGCIGSTPAPHVHGTFTTSSYVCGITEGQALAAQELAEAISDLGTAAYRAGRQEGLSIIERLSTGDISVTDYDKETTR